MLLSNPLKNGLRAEEKMSYADKQSLVEFLTPFCGENQAVDISFASAIKCVGMSGQSQAVEYGHVYISIPSSVLLKALTPVQVANNINAFYAVSAANGAVFCQASASASQIKSSMLGAA